MLYAPVIIPTLNRIEHLKRCIDSLKRNSYAKDTEVYIGLDYPPSEKYEKGYAQVKEYLEQGIEGFKEVYVFAFSENRGVFENTKFLINKVSENNRAFIFTEDDNVFSPCFLEYMDRCLEEYEYDDEVIAVCGSEPGLQGKRPSSEVFKAKYYSAYGCGRWIAKEKRLRNIINRSYIEDVCCNPYKMKEIKRNNTYAFRTLCSLLLRKEQIYTTIDGTIPFIDATIQIYALAEGKYSIFTQRKMVRNTGYDGSGINCGIAQPEIATRTIVNDTVYGDIKNVSTYDGKLEKKPSFKENCLIISAQIRIVIWRIIAKREIIKKI